MNKAILLAIPAVAVAVGLFAVLGYFNTPAASPASAIASQTSGGSNDFVRIHGIVQLNVIGPDGKVKDSRSWVDNLVTTNGFKGIAYRVFNASSGLTITTPYNYVALGTSGTAENAADTALGNENCGGSYARVIQASPAYSSQVITLTATFNQNFSCSIQEAGTFDASSSGHILSHKTFSTVSKGTADTVQVTWTYTLS